MTKFALYGKLVAQPGKRDELVGVLLEAARTLGDMPECELYLVSTVVDEPDAIAVFELWADEGAHDRSLEREDVLALIRRGKPLIAEFVDSQRLTPAP